MFEWKSIKLVSGKTAAVVTVIAGVLSAPLWFDRPGPKYLTVPDAAEIEFGILERTIASSQADTALTNVVGAYPENWFNNTVSAFVSRFNFLHGPSDAALGSWLDNREIASGWEWVSYRVGGGYPPPWVSDNFDLRFLHPGRERAYPMVEQLHEAAKLLSAMEWTPVTRKEKDPLAPYPSSEPSPQISWVSEVSGYVDPDVGFDGLIEQALEGLAGAPAKWEGGGVGVETTIGHVVDQHTLSLTVRYELENIDWQPGSGFIRAPVHQGDSPKMVVTAYEQARFRRGSYGAPPLTNFVSYGFYTLSYASGSSYGSFIYPLPGRQIPFGHPNPLEEPGVQRFEEGRQGFRITQETPGGRVVAYIGGPSYRGRLPVAAPPLKPYGQIRTDGKFMWSTNPVPKYHYYEDPPVVSETVLGYSVPDGDQSPNWYKWEFQTFNDKDTYWPEGVPAPGN